MLVLLIPQPDPHTVAYCLSAVYAVPRWIGQICGAPVYNRISLVTFRETATHSAYYRTFFFIIIPPHSCVYVCVCAAVKLESIS